MLKVLLKFKTGILKNASENVISHRCIYFCFTIVKFNYWQITLSGKGLKIILPVFGKYRIKPF